MKFNTDQSVLTSKALRMIKAAGLPEAPPQTVQQVICQLLLQGMQNEQASYEDKMKRYKLLDKVSDDTIVDLNLTEIGVVTKISQSVCPTLVCGCLDEFFNNPMKELPTEVAAAVVE